MDNSLWETLSHAIITCSFFSCWRGVRDGDEPRGVSLEQVGNTTTPAVLKREHIRVEPLHPFVTVHWPTTAVSGLCQEWLMNDTCLSLADPCSKCVGSGLEWNKTHHWMDRQTCSEDESHYLTFLFFFSFCREGKDLTLTEITEWRSCWFSREQDATHWSSALTFASPSESACSHWKSSKTAFWNI